MLELQYWLGKASLIMTKKNENGDDNKSLTMYVEMFAHCAEGFYLCNSALRTNPNPVLVKVILFLFSSHSYAGNFMLLEDLWPMQ